MMVGGSLRSRIAGHAPRLSRFLGDVGAARLKYQKPSTSSRARSRPGRRAAPSRRSPPRRSGRPGRRRVAGLLDHDRQRVVHDQLAGPVRTARARARRGSAWRRTPPSSRRPRSAARRDSGRTGPRAASRARSEQHEHAQDRDELEPAHRTGTRASAMKTTDRDQVHGEVQQRP